MELILGPLLVFLLRVTDVSIGTMRVLYAVRGKRLIAAGLGFLESGIFIIAICRVFQQMHNPMNMLGYACGFATGTALGMTLEKWIGSGSILARVISREDSAAILEALREAHFGVTAVEGKGRNGNVLVLFVVCPRKRGQELMNLVNDIDADAFVTIDSVSAAIGGYLPQVPLPSLVRK